MIYLFCALFLFAKIEFIPDICKFFDLFFPYRHLLFCV